MKRSVRKRFARWTGMHHFWSMARARGDEGNLDVCEYESEQLVTQEALPFSRSLLGTHAKRNLLVEGEVEVSDR